MTAPVAAGLTPTVVAGAAVAALLLVGVAYEAVGALVTVVHEGAHTLVGILTGQQIEYFEVIVGGRGRTQPKTAGWWHFSQAEAYARWAKEAAWLSGKP